MVFVHWVVGPSAALPYSVYVSRVWWLVERGERHSAPDVGV